MSSPLPLPSPPSFISLDLEMSGLPPPPSYLTPPKIRFNQMLEGIKTYVPLQIGLTIFTEDDSDQFKAETRTYYCWNKYDNDFGGLNKVGLNVSSTNFLVGNSFDYNKCFKEGLPLTTTQECEKIRSNFEKRYPVKRPLKQAIPYPPIPTKYLQKISQTLTSVRTFLDTSSQNSLTLSDTSDYDFRRLRKTVIESVWLQLDVERGIVHRRSENDKEKMWKEMREKEEEKVEEKCFLSDLWREIRKYKIVVHLGIYDILFLEHYLSSPITDYDDFMGRLKEIDVVDTKHLGNKIRAGGFIENYENGSLEKTYKYWEREKVKDYIEEKEEGQYHDAGWDSYCTGYVYVHLDKALNVKDWLNTFYVMKCYYTYSGEGVDCDEVWFYKVGEGEETGKKVYEWKEERYLVEKEERKEGGGWKALDWEGEERVGWVEWVLGKKKRKRDD